MIQTGVAVCVRVKIGGSEVKPITDTTLARLGALHVEFHRSFHFQSAFRISS